MSIDLSPGDRIELVNMPNDPFPIKKGTQGTVLRVESHMGSYHVIMDWDPEIESNGGFKKRILNLVVPPDQYKKIESL